MKKSDDEDIIIPGTPPRIAPIVEESQGEGTIFVKPLAIRTQNVYDYRQTLHLP